MDPKQFDDRSFVEYEGDVAIIPPNSFALATSIEYFRIPRNVLTISVGKSTYAPCGIITNVTPFEPEWEGHVTLEISNTTPLPAKIYAGEGISEVYEVSYGDRKGKYQKQTAVETMMVEHSSSSSPHPRRPGPSGGQLRARCPRSRQASRARSRDSARS